MPPVLELPTDRPRRALPSLAGRVRPLVIPDLLCGGIRDISRQHGVTPFIVLMAVYESLLCRYTGQTDFGIGVPIAGRNRLEIESLIGFFVNTLVIRTGLEEDPLFLDLIRRTREVALEAYAHQDVPFERLVQELAPERMLGHSPLFQVVLAFQEATREAVSLRGLSLMPFGVETGTAKFDLSLSLVGDGLRIWGGVEYPVDLFDETTAERLIGHFLQLLAAGMADPQRHLSQMGLLTESEAHALIWEWNDTAVERRSAPLVHELFAWHARRRPDAVAVRWEGGQLSYGELERRSNRLAHHLRSRGVGAEVRVALCTDRTPERVTAIVAVLKAGGAYLSLDPAYPRERLALLLTDAGAPVLLTDAQGALSLPTNRAAVIRLDGGWGEVQGEEEGAPSPPLDPSNLAYVVYTSGSTGRPKGVGIPHAGLLNLVLWYQDCFDLRPGDRGTQVASPAFDASVVELWPFLAGGGELSIPEEETRLSSPGMVRWWSETGITLAYLMTPLAEGVLEELRRSGAGLPLAVRSLFTGGDRLHGRPTAEVGFQLWNTYGPAEYTVTTSAIAVEADDGSALPSIGRPLPNTQVHVLDRFQQPCPVGVPGELYVGGIGLARGYLDAPARTAEKFVPSPAASLQGEPGGRMYRTADLVRWLPDGSLEFLGRLDRQVKIRGLRIELGEIESVLGQHPDLREVAVLVREDRPGARRLTAYAVAREPATPPPSETLRRFLADRLPEYMVPAAFVFLDALPLTPNGKVDHRALPEPHRSNSDLAELIGPRDTLELELIALWQAVLDVQPIGVRERFFELGGHSLLAVRLITVLRERFQRDIPLALLFQEGTVEGLARMLRGGAGVAEESPLLTLRASGDLPALFLAHPAGGGLAVYGRLVQHLGSAQPVHGFQARGLATEDAPQSRIEEMASSYVRSLRAFQPGPYHLAGASMGALVAFEVACQLRSMGDEVKLLALIDPPPPNSSPADDLGEPEDLPVLRLFASEYGLAVEQEQLEPLTDEERLARLVDLGTAAGVIPATVDRAIGILFLRRMVRVFKAGAVAARKYVPGIYSGQITLLRAAERLDGEPKPQEAGDWSRHCSRPITVLSISGNHNTMLGEPHVRRVASLLRELVR
jgi:amino acid adenylation domain-containing protein